MLSGQGLGFRLGSTEQGFVVSAMGHCRVLVCGLQPVTAASSVVQADRLDVLLHTEAVVGSAGKAGMNGGVQLVMQDSIAVWFEGLVVQ